MINPDTYIRASIMPESTDDLRHPGVDETPLSPHEVAVGISDGTIAPGPVAVRMVDVYVLQRRTVEVFELQEAFR